MSQESRASGQDLVSVEALSSALGVSGDVIQVLVFPEVDSESLSIARLAVHGALARTAHPAPGYLDEVGSNSPRERLVVMRPDGTINDAKDARSAIYDAFTPPKGFA